jgi:hypothetical protein
MRRFYERQRNGRAVFSLELDVVSVEEMLVHEGLLAAGKDHDHEVVAAALAKFITLLSKMHFNLPPGDVP